MNACDLETALLRATTTGTMLQEHELCFLYALAGMATDGPAVECGVYKGGSLSVWCGARRNGDPVYAVDTWIPPKWCLFEAEFYAQMERHQLSVTTLKMESWDAPAAIGEPVAFCFVDSSHDMTGVPMDMEAWTQAIKPGGVLVFHDYGVWKPTIVVKKYVDEWQKAAKWWPLGVVGSAAAFMRPRGVAIGGTR